MRPALKLLTESNLSIVPVRTDGTKRPLVRWEKFTEHPPATREVERWYSKWPNLAIAIIAGKVSGNVEIIDIDDGDLLTEFFEQVSSFGGDHLLTKLVIIETPRPGYHLYYRCTAMDIPGNLKLAMKPNPDDPRHPLTLIETRGEGGYAITPVSPRAVHDTGREYKYIQRNFEPGEIHDLTVDERQILIDAARSLTQVIEDENIVRDRTPHQGAIGTRPGDEFNAKATWHEILEPIGWTVVRSDGDTDYWRQPQKQNKGWSASTNHNNSDLLYVFSSNCHPFDGGKGYTKFTALAITQHKGDFAEAARTLGRQGYGIAPRMAAKKAEGDNETVTLAGFDHLFGTDFAAGKRFQVDWQHVIKYCEPFEWMHYRDGVWHEKQHKMAEMLGKVTAQRFDGQIATLPIELRVEAVKASKGMHSAKGIKNMLVMASSEDALLVDYREFDGPDTYALLNCRNGVLDLNTKTLMPHDPKFMMTKQIPVAYDPHAQCPRFKKFMEEIFDGDFETIAFMYRWMGYCLSSFTNEEKLIFLHGGGANGKTVLRNVIIWLMGPLLKTIPKAAFLKNDRDQTQNMTRSMGARVMVTQEISETDRLEEGHIKDFVTGETQSGKLLFKDGIDITPRAKLWMHGNHLPRITGTDEGIWRRLLLVHFGVTFDEKKKDKFLADKLKRELPGILNLAVAGYQQWIDGGLAAPEAVTKATNEFREESNTVGVFVSETCEMHDCFDIQGKALYRHYSEWSVRTGRMAVSDNRFGREMTRLGFGKFHKQDGTYYKGVRISTGTN